MADIASLGIKITTDGADKAKADLDAVAASGAQAEASAGGIGKAWQGAAAGVSESSATISKSARAVTASFTSMPGDPFARERAGLAALGNQLRAEAIAHTEGAAAVKAYQSALAQSSLTAAESLAAENAINVARDRGVISANAAAQAIGRLAKINVIDAAATDADTAAIAVNARTSRELGTILSEIATGRTGNARRSIGALANSTGLLAKIFTPLGFAITAAAAAVVGFGVSAAKGADEASQLNKALVLTGNYAGATSEDLQTMAASMRTFGTTQHQASEALAEVAKSGTFTASQIGLVGQAALDMSRSTGQSINETIKQFQSLQNEPVKAVLKLNESQHFLTTAIYDQIKALEDQGHAQDAANLAMQTYARTVADRTSQIHDNLGIIQKSWEGIKGATNAAIDAAMNWGRQLTGQAQFNDIFEKRQKLLAQQASGVTIIAAQDAKGGFAGIIPIQQQIDAYTKQLGQLQDARVAAQKAANQTQLQSEAVQALAQSDAEAEIYATNQEKRKTKILAAFNKANDGIVKAMEAGDTAAAERIAANYVKINDGINAKYADKVQRTPRVRVPKDNSDRARQQALDELRQEVQWQGKLDDATQAYQNSLDDMLATRRQQIALQVESVGMGQKEFAQKKELLQIDSEYNRQLASMNKSYEHEATTLAANGQLDRLAEAKTAYEKQKDALKKYHDDRIKIARDGYAAEAAAQGNASLGIQAAMKDFIDTQKNLAKQAYDFTQNFATGFSDAFASFVSGTESAKKAFGDFIDSMYQQALKFVANQAISKLFQILGGTHQETFGVDSLTNGFNISGGGDSGGGGFWSSLFGAFFGGGRASGGSVSAGGLYRVNENGPELLNVGSQSYLMMGSQGGSVTPNAGSRGNVTVNQTVVVQGLSNRRTREQLAQETARVQRVATARNG